ncbi:MAG TPA: hypothetical protein VK540_17395 [Polyangiaceae bacterium]|jgi:hypothetical protein|nr:hypothetical protein [Polyangiaceae bacterium]
MGAPDLLTPTRLFERYFWSLYPEDVRADLTRARATDANPAGNPHILRSLDEIADTFVVLAPSAFAGADLRLDGSDASVHRLAAALDRKKRDRWASERGPDGAPLLTHVVVHGAVYVGRCAVTNHGGIWQVRRPLWESLVRLQSAAGQGNLAVFQWWLKSLSDGEIDRGTLSDRYRAHVEEPRLRPETLPPILDAERRIPRLAKVRYDTLYKHLRAHLPELADLGEHFPTAERFAELGFRHLDFLWLGGTRMLLVHGPGATGVHFFWLGKAGFAKGAYYPADAGSAYELAVEGETLCVTISLQGARAEHVMLWWGP